MEELWCCTEDDEWEFFDSEETARLAYNKWCIINNEEFDEDIFQMCYKPIHMSKGVTVWTKDNIDKYNPS